MKLAEQTLFKFKDLYSILYADITFQNNLHFFSLSGALGMCGPAPYLSQDSAFTVTHIATCTFVFVLILKSYQSPFGINSHFS